MNDSKLEKLKFGIKEYFRPTPKKVKRFQVWWKGIIASTAFVSYQELGLKQTILVGVIGFVVNELCEFLGEHPEILAVEKAKRAIKDTVEVAAQEIIDENETIN